MCGLLVIQEFLESIHISRLAGTNPNVFCCPLVVQVPVASEMDKLTISLAVV